MAGFDPFGALAGLVGGGLGFMVGGPMGAAVGSGLGTTAYSGDIGKGIMSGLLSYGMGSAVDSLASFGGEAVGAASGGAGSAAGPLWSGGYPADVPYDAMGASLSSSGGAGANVPASMLDKLGDKVGSQFDKFGMAANNLTNPDALKKTFLDNAMNTTVPLGLGAYGMASGMAMNNNAAVAKPMYQPMPYVGSQGTGRVMKTPPQGFRPGVDPEFRYYAEGGKVFSVDDPKFDPKSFDDESDDTVRYTSRGATISPGIAERYGRYQDRLLHDKRSDDWYRAPSKRSNPDMRFATGGPISGPGGGLDDAIPAIINGRHPASLSSGEYVVPAHAVSALGNGSTEDGVRHLDGMVDRTLQAKYGTKNRKPRPISPQKMMSGVGSAGLPFAQGGQVPNPQPGIGDYLRYYAYVMGDDAPRRTPMGDEWSYAPSSKEYQPQEEHQMEEPQEDPSLAAARDRISRIESSGNYKALGPEVGNDRAYGRYQVMGANIPSWTKDALGKSMTPDEYLADQKAQDAVFNHRFGGYMKKYGPSGATRAWFAGEGGMDNSGARDVLGTSVADYERRFAS